MLADRRGQAIYEMAALLPFFLVIFSGVLYIGPLIFLRVAADTAAYNCASHAGRTLNPVRGYLQGTIAARETLHKAGIRSATVSVVGSWSRGEPIVCVVEIGYEPLTRLASWTGGNLTIRATAITYVETFKSRWE